MPISYNGGTANFAALMPYQNFAQKAAYKQQDALYLNEINKIEDEKMARVNEMQKNIADNAAALAAMPVEPQDVARLRSEIETKTADALKEMRSSGDPESWLRNNGKIVGTDLTRKVLTGDVLTNMSVNKASMAKINDDLANGRRMRDMDVTFADGTVTKLDSKAAIDKWRNGEITRIQYDSGYDVPDVGKVMAFAATNDNPDYFNVKNKEQVTFLQYKNLLSRDIAAKNMSEKEIDDYAKETYNPAFKWNNNNVRYQQQSLQEQRANRQQKQAASVGPTDSLYNQAITQPHAALLRSAIASGTNNIGFNSPSAVKSDGMALTRLLSRNKQQDKGLVNIDGKQRGYWYMDKNGNNIPLGHGGNLQFETNGNVGFFYPPGSSDKNPSKTNLIIGGTGYLPIEKTTTEKVAKEKALAELGFSSMEQADAANLEFKGISHIGNGYYYAIGGLGVNHTIPKEDSEIMAEAGIVNSTKFEQEGK